jgi:hypothetical protein
LSLIDGVTAKADIRRALQTFQIQRSAGFRARAGFTFTAKRLHADDRTDDITIHINIADMSAAGDEINRFINP